MLLLKGNVWLLCAETQHSMIDILETVCEVSNSVIPWLKVKCMTAVFGRYKVKQEWDIKGVVWQENDGSVPVLPVVKVDTFLRVG